MRELLDRFDAIVAQHRPGYFGELAPGVTPAELSAYEAELGLALPPDVREFYLRHDGQARDHFEGLWYNRTLMDLQAMVECRAGWNELLEMGDFEQPNWWNPLWIPFAENGAGDCYAIDLTGCFGGKPGQIVEVWHDSEDRDVYWPDFRSWLETIVVAHEEGFLNLDADEAGFDVAEANLAIYERVYRRLNPGYPIRCSAADERQS